MFPLKNTEAYIHANGFRSTLGKELADRDAEINDLGSEIQALTNYVADTGVKNFIPLTLENIKALNTTGTWTNNVYSQNGATIEVVLDSNNSVTGLKANGTPSADVTFKVGVPKEGDILTGCPSGGGWSTYVVFQSNGATDTGNGASGVLANVPVNIYLVAGNAFSNLIFYPMVRDASITDPTYQPYAKTNVELTQESASADYTDQSLFTNIDDTAIARPNLRVYKRGSAIYGIFTFDIIRTVTNGEVLFKAPIAPKVDTNFVGTGVGTSDLAQGFVWKSNGNVCSYGSNTAADYISSSVSTIIS